MRAKALTVLLHYENISTLGMGNIDIIIVIITIIIVLSVVKTVYKNVNLLQKLIMIAKCQLSQYHIIIASQVSLFC